MRKATSKADTTHPTITSGNAGTILNAANRSAGSVYNEGPGTLYLKYGPNPSVNSYKVQIATGELWHIHTEPVWTGIVTGFASGGDCVLAVSEEY